MATLSNSLPVRTETNPTLWQQTTRGMKQVGRFVLNETALIGVSAMCGYVGTKLFGELPLNAASKALNMMNMAERNGWIYLNAPGMAVVAAATVPIFQISNKIFPEAVNTDGTKKTVNFNLADARQMAGAGFSGYVSLKVMETLFSGVSFLSHVFQVGNANELLPATVMGVGSAFAVWDGMDTLSQETAEREAELKAKAENLNKDVDLAPSSVSSKKFSLGKLEIIAGLTGLALLAFKSAYTYATTPEATHELTSIAWSYLGYPLPELTKKWSWVTLDATGMASRIAVAIPIQILVKQVFSRITNDNKIPEPIRKASEILGTVTSLGASSYLAGYLGLPGSTLDNPLETMINVAKFAGGFYLLEKSAEMLVYGMDYLFPEKEEAVTVPSFNQKG